MKSLIQLKIFNTCWSGVIISKAREDLSDFQTDYSVAIIIQGLGSINLIMKL